MKTATFYVVVDAHGLICNPYDTGHLFHSAYAARVAARRAGDSMWGGRGKHTVEEVTICKKQKVTK